MFTKLDNMLLRESFLCELVKMNQDLMLRNIGVTDWDKFIKTKYWLVIYEQLTDNFRDLFKNKWLEMEKGHD